MNATLSARYVKVLMGLLAFGAIGLFVVWLPSVEDAFVTIHDKASDLPKYLVVAGILAILCIQAVLIFPPLTPSVVLAIVLLGPVLGFATAWLGCIGGSILCWLVARKFRRLLFRPLLKRPLIRRVNRIVRRRSGLLAVLLLYFSSVVSFDVLAYLLGFSRAPRRTVLIAYVVGPIPKLALITAATGGVSAQLPIEFSALLILAASAVMIGSYLKQRRSRR